MRTKRSLGKFCYNHSVMKEPREILPLFSFVKYGGWLRKLLPAVNLILFKFSLICMNLHDYDFIAEFSKENNL